ncbi:MAG: hypothetical protein ABGY43_01360 [bacterium]|jgi:hypothetical protein|nr:hypothetical protein [Gammaproteobacteria bacterium]HIL85004.1 hypothetical protein [Pseudomonadales bacterium]
MSPDKAIFEARQAMSFDTLAEFKAFIVDFLFNDTEASIANARIEFQIFDEGLRDEVIRSIAARKLAGLMVAIVMFILLGVSPTREDSIACLEDEFDHMRISN